MNAWKVQKARNVWLHQQEDCYGKVYGMGEDGGRGEVAIKGLMIWGKLTSPSHDGVSFEGISFTNYQWAEMLTRQIVY